MKYILKPIGRLVMVVMIVVNWFILGLVFLPFWCLYDFSIKPIKWWANPAPGAAWQGPYIPLSAKPGYKFYYYQTAWDYIVGKKTWDFLADDWEPEEL